MKTKYIIIFLMIIMITPVAIFAENYTESGHGEHGHNGHEGHRDGAFSGMIQTGGVWMNTTNQLDADSDNKFTKTLNEDADAYNNIDLFILFDLRYTLSFGTQLYLSTPFEDEDPVLACGFVKNFSNGSNIDISAFFEIYRGKIWKDPYLTNENRSETNVDAYGTAIRYKNIMGTGFSANYKYQIINVDKDIIGEKYFDLKRDGGIHYAGIEYKFSFEKNHQITPSIEISDGRIDGKSNSFKGFDGKLTYSWNISSYILELSGSIGGKEYQKISPIFNKKRHDKEYGTMGMVMWLNPLGFNKWIATIGIEYKVSDANINFYDSRTIAIFSTIGYQF
ncbi:MAG: DUF2860 family protein [Desulfobacterales bacterium]|nr:DUF2860 family protein [Desulfobacterales bacterium]